MRYVRTLALLAAALLTAGCLLRPPSAAPTVEDYLRALPREKLKQELGAPQPNQPTQPPVSDQPASSATTQVEPQAREATLKTSLGDITITFYLESPATVANFVKLARSGFYDGIRFHRVIKDFMVQTGDPNSKDDDWSNDGTGGPGYTFPDEFNSHKLVRGSVAMANAGPDTNGSQFFIVTAPETAWLDGKHTNFAFVSAGLDVVDHIEQAKANAQDHPLQDITIKSVTVR